MSHVKARPHSWIACCIYYQRIFRNGNLDPRIGIYRDAEDGPCEICIGEDEIWKERVIDGVIVCDSKFEVAIPDSFGLDSWLDKITQKG